MRRSSRSDGYVTLAVLLTAALLAAVVSSLVAVSRPALGLVRIGAEEVTAQGLLEGGVAAAAYLLFEAEREAEIVNGLSLRRKTGDIRIRAESESGRVDINTAERALLEGLFDAIGGTSMDRAAFASRIVDWRDQDDDASPGGAEAADYEDEGLGYRPSNRPFRSVDEMRFVLGLSAADVRRLEPFVTVHARQPGIDPLSAPEVVLNAIPELGRTGVERILQARRQGVDRERVAALVPQAAQFLITTAPEVYRIGVRVRLSNGFADGVVAVIAAPRSDDEADYRVVAWSRLAAVRSR